MKPGKKYISADISEEDECQHFTNRSEERVHAVENIASTAIIGIIAVREAIVATGSTAYISEFFLVAGGAESSFNSFGEVARFFIGCPL